MDAVRRWVERRAQGALKTMPTDLDRKIDHMIAP
jgi:hypothetical protein